MKKLLLAFLFSGISLYLSAQNAPCSGHPLFSLMPNHSVRSCDEKEFDEMEIYTQDAKRGRMIIKKQGHMNMVQIKFNGDFDKRPSTVQIVENYANAIKQAGGTLLYKSESSVYGSLKKGGDMYWTGIGSDGSGDYWIKSVKEEAMKQDVVVKADAIKNGIKDEGKVVFYGIYFDTDKSTLKPESDPTLAEIAKFLKANPGTNVFIVGHTDNTGDFNHNLTLSKERADAVVARLVSAYAINKAQVTAQGVASLSPVASNDTKEGQAKNRRVEIVKK